MPYMKGVHVSFDIVEEFIPRVPRQRCPGEDMSIPRICVADTILDAINAIPQAGLVMKIMKDLNLPVVVHAYYLAGNGIGNDEVQKYVPDAKPTGEFWITEKPQKVQRVDYQVTDFSTKEVIDPFGHNLTVILDVNLRRCRFQNNTENFLHSFGKISEKREKRILKIFEENSFRTVIASVGNEIKERKNN